MYISPALKRGVITPVLKKGYRQISGNYNHGIRVTPLILKMLEPVLNERHKVVVKGIRSKLQLEFIKSKSSQTSGVLIMRIPTKTKVQETAAH